MPPSLKLHLVLLVGLAALASARTLKLEAAGTKRPLLRALHRLRGGAIVDATTKPLLWARHTDNGTSVLLIRSLAAFCETHGLDEEEMLAVSRGESDEHMGWQCGEASAYDAPEEVETVEAVAEADEAIEADEDDDEVEVDEEEASPGVPATSAPPRSKMLVGLVAPMLAVQVMKRFDQASPSFIPGLRIFYFAVVAFNVLVQLAVQWRIRVTNDKTAVAMPPNPLAMLLGGNNNEGGKTAAEYDAAQLKSLRTSYQLGCLFTLFLHFKFKMTQPLVYSSVSGLVDLFYNPLVQIHLLSQPAAGHLARPFGSGSPGLASLFNASAAPPGGGGGLAELLGGLTQ